MFSGDNLKTAYRWKHTVGFVEAERNLEVKHLQRRWMTKPVVQDTWD